MDMDYPISVDEVLDRLKSTLGIEAGVGSDTELAAMLGITRQAVSKSRKTNQVSWGRIITLCLREHLDLNLIIRGKPYRDIEIVPGPDINTQILELRELATQMDRRMQHLSTQLTRPQGSE